MFQRLLGKLVCRQVIFLPVVHRRSAMCVGRQFMKFRSSLVGIVWHSGPLFAVTFILEPIYFPGCPISDTSVFLRNLLSEPHSIAISFSSLAMKGRRTARPNANTAVLKLLLSTDGSILAKA
jgi:hypothetical protein